jgi:hypothetical protein
MEQFISIELGSRDRAFVNASTERQAHSNRERSMVGATNFVRKPDGLRRHIVEASQYPTEHRATGTRPIDQLIRSIDVTIIICWTNGLRLSISGLKVGNQLMAFICQRPNLPGRRTTGPTPASSPPHTHAASERLGERNQIVVRYRVEPVAARAKAREA